MKRSIHPNISQVQFDFDSLSLLPIPDNAEIGLIITLLPEPAQEQEYWWSELEYQKISRTSGIYTIVNMLNRHFYIGSAVSLYRRKIDHFKNLKAGKHHSIHLQRAYSKYGADAFRFAIIEHIELAETLIEREQYYIDTLLPEYNICTTAGSLLGIKHTEEARKNMSEAHKGKPLSPASITKREATRKTRREAGEYAPVVRSEETRARMGAAHKGNKYRKGKTFSPESIAQRETTKRTKREADPTYGKKREPMSEAQKEKLSKALKGNTNAKKNKTEQPES